MEYVKSFPDKNLFYIFYSMPFDKAQEIAANELKSRSWVYCGKSLRWMKAGTVTPPKSSNKKARSARKEAERIVVVFNPQLWKEETLTVLEN